MNEIHQERLGLIISEYHQRLEEVLGDELDSIVLYGSHARGDAEPGSDIDILCIIKRPFDYGELILKTSRVTAEVSLKYDVVLSRSFVSRDDYASRRTPFLTNVHREQAVL